MTSGAAVRDFDSTVSRAVVDFHMPSRGILAAAVRPSMRQLGWFCTDLLTASGRHGLRVAGSAGWAASAAAALAWMTVGNITDVVVGASQDVPAALLADLLQYFALADVRAWLVFDGFVSDASADVVESFGLPWVSVDAFCAKFVTGAPSAALSQTAPVDGACAFPSVPNIAAPMFLAECRRLLSSADLALVIDAVRCAAAASMPTFKQATVPDEEKVAFELHSYIAETGSADEAVCALRGFQIAALRCGVLLQVDLRRFLNRAPGGVESGSWGEGDWARLDVLARPRDSACAVLAFLGLPPDEIAALPAEAVAEDGTVVVAAAGCRDVPAPAQRFLVAQRLYRLMTSALNDDLFLSGNRGTGTLTPYGVAQLLTQVGVMTGLPVRTRWTREPKGIASWRHRLGLSLRVL